MTETPGRPPRIERLRGQAMDAVVNGLGIDRLPGEGDEALRTRIADRLGFPRPATWESERSRFIAEIETDAAGNCLICGTHREEHRRPHLRPRYLYPPRPPVRVAITYRDLEPLFGEDTTPAPCLVMAISRAPWWRRLRAWLVVAWRRLARRGG